jgi:peroxiredoxin Q/BCP
MKPASRSRRTVLHATLALLWLAGCSLSLAADGHPKVGDKAADFTLNSLDGSPVKLSDATAKGSVVLVVLRGFPGYQCPLCSRQVGEFVAKGAKFREAGATVLLVYPGPGIRLKDKATEFAADKKLPEGFTLLLDQDFAFTHAWKLRWDAPNETAYPSTFVIEKGGKIRFAKISREHGGRSSADEVLKALGK